MKNRIWVDQQKAERFLHRNRVTLWRLRQRKALRFKRIGPTILYSLDFLREFKKAKSRTKGGDKTHV